MKNLALYFDIELIKAIFKNYVIECYAENAIC